MGGRFRIEVALAEHRTTASLDGGRIQGPVGIRCVRCAHGKQRQGERDTPSFEHDYLHGEKLCSAEKRFCKGIANRRTLPICAIRPTEFPEHCHEACIYPASM